MRKNNTHGGGATTNLNGLKFERNTELCEAISKKDFKIEDNDVFYKGEKIATLYQKHGLYKRLLEPNNINYKDYISKKILPDDCILNHTNNTLYVIEKKFQLGSGSVDEKLQTCDFKKKQYMKLMKPLNINVEYCYLLSEWFIKPEYDDVKQYIKDCGCEYFFNEIPIEYLNLNYE